MHLGLIFEVYGDGLCAAVLVRDDGIVATHLLTLERVGLRGDFLTIECQDGGNGDLGVFDKEFSRDFSADTCRHVLAHNLEGVGVYTEVIRAELAEFLTTGTQCQGNAQTQYIAQFTIHN